MTSTGPHRMLAQKFTLHDIEDVLGPSRSHSTAPPALTPELWAKLSPLSQIVTRTIAATLWEGYSWREIATTYKISQTSARMLDSTRLELERIASVSSSESSPESATTYD